MSRWSHVWPLKGCKSLPCHPSVPFISAVPNSDPGQLCFLLDLKLFSTSRSTAMDEPIKVAPASTIPTDIISPGSQPHLSRSLTSPEISAKYAKRMQRSFGPLFRAYALALRSKIMGGTGDLAG